jgi:hypothetical protein
MFLGRSNIFGEMPSMATFFADLNGLWLSYWAFFGWFSMPVPGEFYWYYNALVVGAAVGIAIEVVAKETWKGFGDRPAFSRQAVLPALLGLCVLAGVFAYRLVVRAFHGRLLLGGISGFAMLLAIGWSRAGMSRGRAIVPIVLATSLAAPAALFPWIVLRPAYRPPPLVDASAIQPATPVRLVFGQTIRLLGVDLRPTGDARVRPGEVARATVYLQGLRPIDTDYLMFLKVVDSDGTVIAEVNTHPGHGTYPTSSWAAGPVLVDGYNLKIPLSAHAPALATVYLGFFLPMTMANLPVEDGQGNSVGTSAPVGSFVIGESESRTVSREGETFYEAERSVIALVPSDGVPADVKPGAAIKGTLSFRCLLRPARDYTVFVHVERSGTLLAQSDGPPGGGKLPTRYWIPGDVVEHSWRIQIPANAPPGDYRVTAGLYDPVSGARLQTTSGSEVVLGTLRLP